MLILKFVTENYSKNTGAPITCVAGGFSYTSKLSYDTATDFVEAKM